MGPEHFSYTPDFTVSGFSIPDSDRSLYIEVKWFGEEMNLTKYVRFTEWYNCDLLVLARYKGEAENQNRKPSLGDLPLKPEKQRYFLILRCSHCNTYDYFPCDERPTDEYIQRQNHPSAPHIQGQNVPSGVARGFPFGYRL